MVFSFDDSKLKIFGKTIKSIADDAKNIVNRIGITPDDISRIEKFLELKKSGVPVVQAFSQSMNGAGKACKQMLVQIVKGEITLEELKESVKSINNIISSFKGVLINFGATLAITFVANKIVSYFTELSQAQENARQEAEKGAQTYQEQCDSIDDYVTRISKLKKSLESGTLSEEEAYDIYDFCRNGYVLRFTIHAMLASIVATSG